MDRNTKHIVNRAPPRRRQTALLYVMRPDSAPEQPVWDLVRIIYYYASHGFALPEGDGLRYMVMSPTGEILTDTTNHPFIEYIG